MLRGTRILRNEEAQELVRVSNLLRNELVGGGFEEIVVPSIWETACFTNKLGEEKEGQMWTFLDKGNRNCCLIPEVTGIIQEMWNKEWNKEKFLPLFYIARCYRYERPQAGRYREFTQVGIEILGECAKSTEIAKESLKACLDVCKIQYEFKDAVKRGLSYYVEDGFEVECPFLGAQRQIAGGGRYQEGIGWAIGLERLILAIKESKNANI